MDEVKEAKQYSPEITGILDQIEKEVQQEAETAVTFALNAPYPDLSEVDQHVYAR